MNAAVQVLRRVSEMVCELPAVVELDARVIMQYQVPRLELYAHMAIHPYPSHLVSHWQLSDGTDVTIRPIRPEDAQIEQDFVRKLSPRSKYFRFMQSLRELTQPMLVRLTQIDYDRETAFIAVTKRQGPEVELGVARYAMNPDGESCEFVLVVADEWQRRGIGSRLTGALMGAARDRGFSAMEGKVLADDTRMLELARSLGFSVRASPHDPGVKVGAGFDRIDDLSQESRRSASYTLGTGRGWRQRAGRRGRTVGPLSTRTKRRADHEEVDRSHPGCRLHRRCRRRL